ncbi:hypothetical protein KL86SPO_70583 [uncultured Sporomusa sp.]|uniref:Uncharacterized protein n=1 Tax=uncultured Sporomusa sp. TaxID=307249 RepID=A0A212M1T4_9FIRM|nr:hypothetical protein [uncultured Sporomusa sp.]SCM83725.1 hypothetical protein KL86SPO_70583 [uncultured Sporomusa sp.]
MITIDYTAITTEGTKEHATFTYDSIEAATADLETAVFSEGCSIVSPTVTDSSGKKYNLRLSITEA